MYCSYAIITQKVLTLLTRLNVVTHTNLHYIFFKSQPHNRTCQHCDINLRPGCHNGTWYHTWIIWSETCWCFRKKPIIFTCYCSYHVDIMWMSICVAVSSTPKRSLPIFQHIYIDCHHPKSDHTQIITHASVSETEICKLIAKNQTQK